MIENILVTFTLIFIGFSIWCSINDWYWGRYIEKCKRAQAVDDTNFMNDKDQSFRFKGKKMNCSFCGNILIETTAGSCCHCLNQNVYGIELNKQAYRNQLETVSHKPNFEDVLRRLDSLEKKIERLTDKLIDKENTLLK